MVLVDWVLLEYLWKWMLLKVFFDKIEVQYKDAMNHTKKVKFVKVEYSWKPEVCNHCVVFGHSFKDCKVRQRTVVEVERDR